MFLHRNENNKVTIKRLYSNPLCCYRVKILKSCIHLAQRVAGRIPQFNASKVNPKDVCTTNGIYIEKYHFMVVQTNLLYQCEFIRQLGPYGRSWTKFGYSDQAFVEKSNIGNSWFCIVRTFNLNAKSKSAHHLGSSRAACTNLVQGLHFVPKLCTKPYSVPTQCLIRAVWVTGKRKRRERICNLVPRMRFGIPGTEARTTLDRY